MREKKEIEMTEEEQIKGRLQAIEEALREVRAGDFVLVRRTYLALPVGSALCEGCALGVLARSWYSGAKAECGREWCVQALEHLWPERELGLIEEAYMSKDTVFLRLHGCTLYGDGATVEEVLAAGPGGKNWPQLEARVWGFRNNPRVEDGPVASFEAVCAVLKANGGLFRIPSIPADEVRSYFDGSSLWRALRS